MTEIGKRIKETRTKLNLTQTELAHKLGFSKASAISKYEKNQLEPNLETIRKISKMGNISLQWLIEGKTQKQEIKENISDETPNEISINYLEDIGDRVSPTFDFYGLKMGMTQEEVKKVFPLNEMTKEVQAKNKGISNDEARQSLSYDNVFASRFYPQCWPEKNRPGSVKFFMIDYSHKNKVCRITLYYETPIDSIQKEALRSTLLKKFPVTTLAVTEININGENTRCFKVVIEKTEEVKKAIKHYEKEFEKMV